MAEESGTRRVVIVGGGFAGLFAARAVSRAPVQVTLLDRAERSRWHTCAPVGAGPTGVELAGQIREVAPKTLRREYRRIKPEDARVLLFAGGSAPLAMFGPKLSGLAARQLGKLGVELHMGSIVTHVDPGGLEVKDHDGTVTPDQT